MAAEIFRRLTLVVLIPAGRGKLSRRHLVVQSEHVERVSLRISCIPQVWTEGRTKVSLSP